MTISVDFFSRDNDTPNEDRKMSSSHVAGYYLDDNRYVEENIVFDCVRIISGFFQTNISITRHLLLSR